VSRQEDIRVRQRKYLQAVVLFLVGLRWVAIGLLAISLLAPMVGVIIANNHARSPEGHPEAYRPEHDEAVPAIDRGPTIDG